MTQCRAILPGNIECPLPPLYVVLSPRPGGLTLERVVCAAHLVESIHHDLFHYAGVRVRMLAWGHAREDSLRTMWDGAGGKVL